MTLLEELTETKQIWNEVIKPNLLSRNYIEAYQAMNQFHHLISQYGEEIRQYHHSRLFATQARLLEENILKAAENPSLELKPIIDNIDLSINQLQLAIQTGNKE